MADYCGGGCRWCGKSCICGGHKCTAWGELKRDRWEKKENKRRAKRMEEELEVWENAKENFRLRAESHAFGSDETERVLRYAERQHPERYDGWSERRVEYLYDNYEIWWDKIEAAYISGMHDERKRSVKDQDSLHI